MKFLKFIIPIAIIGILAFLGFNKLQSNKKIIDEKADIQETVITNIPVMTAYVKSIDLNTEMEVVGTFEARKELTIIAESQGRLTNLMIEEGQYISQGQAVATIDDTAIQSQLMTAQASLEKARKDVERYKNLLDVGAISQTQYEEIKLGMQNQLSSITAIEQQLKYTTAKSPMSGIIKEIMLESGSFANLGTEIASVVDISKLNMIIKLDEKDIVKVKRGQVVKIITEVYPDKTFNGRVKNIAVQADIARKYDVSIELTNSKSMPLKAGMYGTAHIPIGNDSKTALVIPRKSVVGSLKQPQVYIVDNETAKLINVEVGESIEENVIILSGLQEGDQIITTGQLNLDNGKGVNVISENVSLAKN